MQAKKMTELFEVVKALSAGKCRALSKVKKTAKASEFDESDDAR